MSTSATATTTAAAGGRGGAAIGLGTTLWSKPLGGPVHEYCHGLSADGLGRIALTGSSYSSTVDFGGALFEVDQGKSAAVVVQLDSAGNHLASAAFTATGNKARGEAAAWRPDGGVIVAGVFQEAIDLGGGPLTSAADDGLFLAAFDADGQHLWSKALGAVVGRWTHDVSVAVDALGNVVVAVSGDGSVDFGGGPLTSTGSSDVFLARLGASGQHLWSQRFASPGRDQAKVHVDSRGDIWVFGWFEESISVGGAVLTTESQGGFVARLDGAGQALYAVVFAGGAVHGLDTTPAGEVVVTLTHPAAVSFAGQTWSNDSGEHHTLVLQLDPQGEIDWATSVLGRNFGLEVAYAGNGSVVVGGVFDEAISVASASATTSGDFDAFVVGMAPDGTPVSMRAFGGPRQDWLWDLVRTPEGVVMCGHFNSSMDLGAGTITTAGSSDMFVAEWVP